MTILVVGLGLIGGSLAKALAQYTGHEIWGLDRDELAVQAALAEGTLARGASLEDLSAADLTFVCLHPRDTIRFLTGYAGCFRTGAMVADVCGVKSAVVEAAHPALKAAGVRYVGCHPMAGREFSGFAYAQADLFQGASFIMTPVEGTDPEAERMLEHLARAVGFGKVVRTTPQHHDRVIAFSSQLAHVVSSAFVKSPTLQDRGGFSAGSFQDMTRVARMNAGMWTELFLANAPALGEELDLLIHSLTEYRQVLAAGDEAGLHALLEEGNRLKIASERSQ